MITSGLARATRAARHPERVEVLAQRREERALHPLLLDAQHHDHVGVGDRLVDRGRHVHAEPLDAGGHQRRRAAHPDLGAELRQQQHVRAQHAAVQQVADDGDLQPVDALLVLADGEGVEQRLRRDARACRRRR